MHRAPDPPCISVLMPAYNAERYILRSVQSVLAQTFEDFELVVVDDCSTDRTAEILDSVRDARLRVVRNGRNLGVVGSRNRAMDEARGRYVACCDADDLCLPDRFAKQKNCLDDHPDVLLVGSEMSDLEEGRVRRSRQAADQDPLVLRWQFHVSNPIGHSTMMFRRSAAGALDAYMRREFEFAEDFDFSHRMLRLGAAKVLPEPLVIYRRHNQSLTKTRQAEMIAGTAAVLRDAYSALLGKDAAREAALAAEHFLTGRPASSPELLEELGDLLDRLVAAFLATHQVSGERAQRVIAHASRIWWTVIQTALRAGHVFPATSGYRHFRRRNGVRPSPHRLARSALGGLVGEQKSLQRLLAGRAPRRVPAPARAFSLGGVGFEAEAIRHDDPPVLHVVVDTEAEFDWNEPFDRTHTGVSAMAAQERAQSIFDASGLRPIYVVDYAVASQPEGYGPLRGFLDRHVCVVGAHLHPWINPPFEEVVSDHNSFGGNLPAGLERRKLGALVEMIRQNLGVSPLFFKAGRYGLGPHTMATLAHLGFAVDFSIMPMTDLRAKGGADFSAAEARSYRTVEHGILSVPMTRAQTGLVAPLPPGLHGALQSRRLAGLRLPGLLSRLGLANTVTLTPEGVTAREQMQLVRAMLDRGHRTFVLHYHSPSLAVGHTPYVRTEADLATFLHRIEAVCRFFFAKVGGLPGNPADLLPQSMRQEVWPRSGVVSRPAA